MANRGSPENEICGTEDQSLESAVSVSSLSLQSSQSAESASYNPEITEEEAEQLSHCGLSDIPIPDAIREKLNALKSVNVLIVGKYKVGKSTLVNSLFDQGEDDYVEHAAEGFMEPTTKKVKSYPLVVGGVTYNIYDTIGLQDRRNRDAEYIKELKEACQIAHLVIYCTKMDEPQRQDEIEVIRNLTAEYGERFWQHAIIALTFANTVDSPSRNKSKSDHFKDLLEMKKNALRQCFRNEGSFCIAKDIQDSLSRRIVPVGSSNGWKLPDIEDWRANFWVECMHVCAEEAKGAFLKIAWNSPKFIAMIIAGAAIGLVGAVAAAKFGGPGASKKFIYAIAVFCQIFSELQKL